MPRRALRATGLPRAVRGAAPTALRALAAHSSWFLTRGPFRPYAPLSLEFMLDRLTAQDFVRYATTELLTRELTEREVPGAVAEVGVCRGEFASVLNRHFPDRPLYLFDTFAGFDAQDVEHEVALGLPGVPYSLPDTSVELVLRRLPHPERAVVCPGWFPESARGHEEERFCFVSVDVGLHAPTLAALAWFHPRLAPGAYLVVADYNNSHTPGVKRAVREFVEATGCALAVIPDYAASAVIVKERPVRGSRRFARDASSEGRRTSSRQREPSGTR